MNKSVVSTSPEDLSGIARQLLDKYPDRKVFAFDAVMGAGKTTFIRTICAMLNVIDNVSSPTFAIINEYDTKKQFRVFHFDFYRIRKLAEAVDIGTEDYFYSGEYCFIEWPEIVETILPPDVVEVKIELDQDTGNRIFTF